MSTISNYQAIIQSPIGPLGIITNKGILYGIDFLPKKMDALPPADRITGQVISELKHYFNNPNWIFTLPLHPTGTSFQRSVWRQLQQIPAGQTRTYGDIAKAIHSGPRAVGNACRGNPLPVVIPCHRVVAASGPGGYAGKTDGPNMPIKRWLLAHEGITL